MNQKLITKVSQYVKDNIGSFHQERIAKLQRMKLDLILRRKNPYLYKAKNLNTPGELIQSIASAYVSSAEETLFGNWMEQLAIFINEEVFNGYKSSAKGVDLEFDNDGVHNFVSIKSGPNWCNSQSLAQLKKDFVSARNTYNTSRNKKIPVRCIEGCCYGKDNRTYTDSIHEKLCGEEFWTFISGEPMLYIDIIEPLGTDAKKKNDIYEDEYNRMITKFTCEFTQKYCDSKTGDIRWDTIVNLVSSKNK